VKQKIYELKDKMYQQLAQPGSGLKTHDFDEDIRTERQKCPTVFCKVCWTGHGPGYVSQFGTGLGARAKLDYS
jgi:hypothetical protein